MPTQDDFQELLDETDNEWTSINGVYGYKFTNKSDSSKYIFLPAAGYCDYSYFGNTDSGGYWSSSLFTGESRSAYKLYFDVSYINVSSISGRCYGYSIRPVSQ